MHQAHEFVLVSLVLYERGKNGPSTIPSLPNGPEVLFFSPKVEDTQN